MTKRKKANPFNRTKGLQSFVSSITSILIGFIVGILVMLICSFFVENADFGQGILILLQGPFAALKPVKELGNMLFYTVPLIFTGLSVAIAYKTGLFNIGAPGQFLLGTMVSLLIALNVDSTGNKTQGIFVWIAAVICGMIAGALWGIIPGLLKAFLGINEVIICIMTNWIAANMFTWVFTNQPQLVNTSSGKSGFLITTAVTGNGTPGLGMDVLFKGSYLDGSIYFAIIIAILLWLLINKTTIGYSMRACGLNKFSAKYAGMNDKLNLVLAMAIAGGMAGLGGCFYYLNPGIEICYTSVYQSLPGYGFDGIPAALLANCNPIAVVFSSIFMRYLYSAGGNLPRSNFNLYFSNLIVAIIIYLSGFSRFFGEKMLDIEAFAEKNRKKRNFKILTADLLVDNIAREGK